MPITEPNSLFSNMIIAMWSKFGTRGFGVAVDVIKGTGVGVVVEVGEIGIRVCVAEGKRMGVRDGDSDRGAHANNEMRTRMQRPKRFIRTSIILPLITYYRFNFVLL